MDTTICGSLNGQLLNAPSDFTTFIWDDNSTSQTRAIESEGTYWVMSKNICHYRVDTFIIQNINYIFPEITINILELGTMTVYDSYQWLLNNNPIQGATNSKYTPTENGTYRVFITTNSGCSDTSNIYEIKNTSIDGLDKIANSISIYPNPSQDIIHINPPVKVDVALSSIEGKIIKRIKNAKSVSLSELSSGIYLLQITDSQGNLIKVEKIIKQMQ